MLLGLVKEGTGVAANVLKNLDLDLKKMREEVEKRIMIGPTPFVDLNLHQTPRVKKVIELALKESKSMGNNFVGTEHLLLGLMIEGAAETVTNDIHLLLGNSIELREELKICSVKLDYISGKSKLMLNICNIQSANHFVYFVNTKQVEFGVLALILIKSFLMK